MNLEFKGFWRFVVFCFVGGTSALIHLIVFNVFFWVFNNISNNSGFLFGASRNYVIATIIAIAISISYNFTMNRNITFSAKQEPAKKQIPRYAVVYALSIGVNFIVSLLVISLIGENTFNANIATFSGIIVSIPISFFGSLLWTFKRN